MANTYDIFLSYQNKDRDWAGRLVEALSEAGLRVWYAQAEIKPGEVLVDRLEEGLRESDYIVFVMPEKQSNWTAVELGAALALRKPLIPIVAEGALPENIPGPIKLRKYLQKGDPIVIADEIARTISQERQESMVAG
jgi:nucleoside 2-deoxyribosyltransferase